MRRAKDASLEEDGEGDMPFMRNRLEGSSIAQNLDEVPSDGEPAISPCSQAFSPLFRSAIAHLVLPRARVPIETASHPSTAPAENPAWSSIPITFACPPARGGTWLPQPACPGYGDTYPCAG